MTLHTVRTGDESPAERLKTFFDGKENVNVEPQTGNLVSISEKDSEEDGDRIHLYYWMVANVVPPDLIREAVFSYAVLLDRVTDDETQQTVSLVGSWLVALPYVPLCEHYLHKAK